MASHSDTKVEKRIENKDGKNITTTTTTTTTTTKYSGDADDDIKRSAFDDDFFNDTKGSGTVTYTYTTSSNGGPPETKTYTTKIGDGNFNDDLLNKFESSNDTYQDGNPNQKVYTITTTTTGSGDISSFDPFADIKAQFGKELDAILNNNDFRIQFRPQDYDDSYNSNLQNNQSASYQKLLDQPSDLPEEYTLYTKPTQKTQEFIPCSFDGRKKALLIGINYQPPNQLRGCINDVKNIKKHLMEEWGFPESNITVLTDDQTDPDKIPNRAVIIRHMKEFVKDVEKGDSLFFHYSGHGGQLRDPDCEEDDGFDETIMPLDFPTKGQIVDDELHHILVDPLPAGCRLTAIFDSCHSGTILDLPYMYTARENVQIPNAKIVDSAEKIRRVRRKNLETEACPAEIILFSGCRDDQTSSDVTINGYSSGAMSHAFSEALSYGKNQNYKELLTRLRSILRGKYSQIPQLSSSFPIDMNKQYNM